MRGTGVRVLIVGAGIAGLAAARALRDWGASIDIVERTPGPATSGTGIYLPGNAPQSGTVISDNTIDRTASVVRTRRLVRSNSGVPSSRAMGFN